MVRKGSILFVTVETPLHAGTGAELGIVDLPIQRERHTGWPKVEASGLKGALREAIIFDKNDRGKDKELKDAIFGPEEGDLHSGALVLTDLRIFLFPVKSGKGTFAWVTSPEVYARFKRDLEALTRLDTSAAALFNGLPDSLEPNKVHNSTKLTMEVEGKETVLLEEYSFEVTKDNADGPLTKFVNWLQMNVFESGNPRHDDIPKKICVVENDMFNDFVKMFTEVITRTRISPDTGTVKTGALWNEEYLPTETVMYSLVMATPVMKKNEKPEELKDDSNPGNEAQKVLNKVVGSSPKYLFLGGNETIGKGLVSLKFVARQGGTS